MKNRMFLAALIVAVALIFTASSLPILEGGYQIGDKVEDFDLQNIDGEWIKLTEYAGEEGVIVIFTCNTCPYAQLYQDRIIELHKKYTKQGFPVIAINPNDPISKPGDSFEAMRQRAKEKNFPFPYVFDAEQTVYPAFGATKTPHVFVLDQSMRVRYIGAIDDNAQDASGVKEKYVENAIHAVKAGKDPDPLKTKAIGCGIKARRT